MGQYQQPEPQLVDAIKTAAEQYLQQLVNDRQISTQMAQHLGETLQQQLNGLIGFIQQSYPSGVTFEQVRQVLAGQIRQNLIALQQQRPETGQSRFIQDPYRQSQYLNTNVGQNIGALSFDKQGDAGYMAPPIKPPTPQYQEPVMREPSTPGNTLVESNLPKHQYTARTDDNPDVYSTKCKSGQITKVEQKMMITDELNNLFNFSKVTCHIPEPAIINVIDNFIWTNPKLCSGLYMADLDYSRFVLRSVKSLPCPPIDLKPLVSREVNELPVDVTITKIIRSIGQRNHDVVANIEKILVARLNDRLKRYVRSSERISQIISVDTLEDVCTLGSYRNKHTKETTFHKGYEATVLRCFREALESVITDMTPTGYYRIEDIVANLLVCPSFVIRENGICEREMATDDPKFIEAINNKYTVFADHDNVVITNFVPEGLEEELERGILLIEKPTNPIDYLLTSRTWGDKAKTIVMMEGDQALIVKNGVTLDGIPFLYRDTVNLDYI